MSEYLEKAESARQRFTNWVEQSAADRNLSDHTKRRDAAQAWMTVTGEIEDARRRHHEEQAKERERLLKKAFGPVDPEGIRPLYLMSDTEKRAMQSDYRDCMARAAGLGDEEAAVSLLRQAHLTGDVLQARAVAATAFDKQWRSVLEAYAEVNPGHAEALNDAGAFRTDADDLARQMMVDMQFAAPNRPGVLGRYSDRDIRRIADDTADAPPVPVEPEVSPRTNRAYGAVR